MPLRQPGLGACPPTENRGECAQETCAITPECAAAAWLAAETNSAGPQETIPPAATSGQKPRLPGLDADASMHSLRSEENTSDVQSLRHLVCRLLLEKKKKK